MYTTEAASVGGVALALSLASSALYAVQVRSRPSAVRMTCKMSATASLAVLAAWEGSHWQLVAALALGSVGDAFLAWPGDRAFVCGLSSFLLAHTCYISLFARIGSGGAGVFLLSDDDRRWTLVAGGGLVLLVAASVMGYTLVSAAPRPLRLPVAAYSAVISVMVLAALTVDNGQVVLGSVLFAVSDSVLAVDEFVLSRGSSFRAVMQHAVWLLYYSGQLLMAAGLVWPTGEGWDWINQARWTDQV